MNTNILPQREGIKTELVTICNSITVIKYIPAFFTQVLWQVEHISCNEDICSLPDSNFPPHLLRWAIVGCATRLSKIKIERHGSSDHTNGHHIYMFWAFTFSVNWNLSTLSLPPLLSLFSSSPLSIPPISRWCSVRKNVSVSGLVSIDCVSIEWVVCVNELSVHCYFHCLCMN